MASRVALQAVQQLLADDATVSGLVSTRIQPGVAHRNWALPYIVLNLISSNHYHHMDSASGLAQERIQVDCYDDNPTDVIALKDAVREALDGYRGTVTTDGSNTVVIRRLHLENDNDFFLPPQDSSDLGTFRGSMDFWVGHTETVPTF